MQDMQDQEDPLGQNHMANLRTVFIGFPDSYSKSIWFSNGKLDGSSITGFELCWGTKSSFGSAFGP